MSVHPPDRRMPTSVAVKWHALALRKLDGLVKQYQTGRWRRYYTEDRFLSELRSTKRLIEEWRSLNASLHKIL